MGAEAKMRIELSTHEQSVININPQEILGDWRAGYALDFHTARNTKQTHTKIGGWVYLVKKLSDRNRIQPLAEVAAKFVKEKFVDNDQIVRPSLIIPVLPSKPRSGDFQFQPVFEIAKEIGKILNLPYKEDYLKKRKTRPIKNLTIADKQEELRGAFAVRNSQHLQGKVILLVDDVYDSGETLKEVTDVLYRQGGVSHVLVLTLTRTRRKDA